MQTFQDFVEDRRTDPTLRRCAQLCAELGVDPLAISEMVIQESMPDLYTEAASDWFKGAWGGIKNWFGKKTGYLQPGEGGRQVKQWGVHMDFDRALKQLTDIKNKLDTVPKAKERKAVGQFYKGLTSALEQMQGMNAVGKSPSGDNMRMPLMIDDMIAAQSDPHMRQVAGVNQPPDQPAKPAAQPTTGPDPTQPHVQTVAGPGGGQVHQVSAGPGGQGQVHQVSAGAGGPGQVHQVSAGPEGAGDVHTQTAAVSGPGTIASTHTGAVDPNAPTPTAAPLEPGQGVHTAPDGSQTVVGPEGGTAHTQVAGPEGGETQTTDVGPEGGETQTFDTGAQGGEPGVPVSYETDPTTGQVVAKDAQGRIVPQKPPAQEGVRSFSDFMQGINTQHRIRRLAESIARTGIPAELIIEGFFEKYYPALYSQLLVENIFSWMGRGIGDWWKRVTGYTGHKVPVDVNFNNALQLLQGVQQKAQVVKNSGQDAGVEWVNKLDKLVGDLQKIQKQTPPQTIERYWKGYSEMPGGMAPDEAEYADEVPEEKPDTTPGKPGSREVDRTASPEEAEEIQQHRDKLGGAVAGTGPAPEGEGDIIGGDIGEPGSREEKKIKGPSRESPDPTLRAAVGGEPLHPGEEVPTAAPGRPLQPGEEGFPQAEPVEPEPTEDELAAQLSRDAEEGLARHAQMNPQAQAAAPGPTAAAPEEGGEQPTTPGESEAQTLKRPGGEMERKIPPEPNDPAYQDWANVRANHYAGIRDRYEKAGKPLPEGFPKNDAEDQDFAKKDLETARVSGEPLTNLLHHHGFKEWRAWYRQRLFRELNSRR